MKKTLLTIFSGILLAGTASAQCVPDPNLANASGNFFPDSATFLMEDYAASGAAYAAVIDMKTIADTVFSGNTAYIDAFKYLSSTGEPAGFTFVGGGDTYEITDPKGLESNTENIWFNNYGNVSDASTLEPVQGCLQITADAASVTAAAPATGFTDYPVTVEVDARLAGSDNTIINNLAGQWLSNPAFATFNIGALQVTDYVIRVYAEDPNGIYDLLNPNAFEVHQSYPNPAGDKATITFTTPNPGEIELRVFNMLGSVVVSEDITAESGINDIELNTGRLSAGLYVYTVSNGTKTFTQKMTVK